MKIIQGSLQPLPDRILGRDLQFGERITIGGLIITDDDGKNQGIHPRWARIWRIGENVKDVEVGDWVLMAHGRWSRTVLLEEDGETFKVNMLDPDGILLKGDHPTEDVYTDVTK